MFNMCFLDSSLFNQSPWLKEYIMFNTAKRAKCGTNIFDKNFYKLMNNSVFGKTMENLRNRRSVEVITSTLKLKTIAAQTSFKQFHIFQKDLVAVERSIVELVLNRPIYVDFCVLDISKILMYNHHYAHVKCKYPGDRSQLLFTDTDSLLYSIETNNIYEDMLEDASLYDFSDYPKDHQCYSEVNKNIIGKFKDEMAGVRICEFVGLKAKMYSILNEKDVELKRAKGVRKYVIKRVINHDDYRVCLEMNARIMCIMNSIQSEKHKLYSVQQNKTSLTAYDDKRYINNDGISSVPYGHYSIYITPKKDGQHHINLLYTDKDGAGHYCLIKSMSRLMGHQYGNAQEKLHICNFCLYATARKDLLDKHVKRCREHGCQRVKMPTEGENSLRFKAIEKQHKLPFVMYADVEAILVKETTPPTIPPTTPTSPCDNDNHHSNGLPDIPFLRHLHRQHAYYPPPHQNQDRIH